MVHNFSGVGSFLNLTVITSTSLYNNHSSTTQEKLLDIYKSGSEILNYIYTRNCNTNNDIGLFLVPPLVPEPSNEADTAGAVDGAAEGKYESLYN